jgi:hypothetical protein
MCKNALTLTILVATLLMVPGDTAEATSESTGSRHRSRKFMKHWSLPRSHVPPPSRTSSVATQTIPVEAPAFHPMTRDASTQTEPPNTWWTRTKARVARMWHRFFRARRSARSAVSVERSGVTESTALKGEFERIFPSLKDFRTDEEIRLAWANQISWRLPRGTPRGNVPIERIVRELKEDGEDSFGIGTGVLPSHNSDQPVLERFTAINRGGNIYFVGLHRRSGFARVDQFIDAQAIEYSSYYPLGHRPG